MDVQIDGAAHTIAIDRTNPDKDAYTLDGREIVDSDARKFYYNITSMQQEADADVVAPSAVSGERVTITLHRNTEKFGEMTLTFTPYNMDFYRAEFNGRSDQLVNKRAVQELISAFSALQQ